MSSAHAHNHMSPEEYLAFEAASLERHEYVDGEIFAMSGTTDDHNDVKRGVVIAVQPRLRGSSCRLYDDGVKLRVEAANVYYYPDVFVTCDARDLQDKLVKRHACLVIEVLSDSTEAYDRGKKFRNYQMLESLCEYVLVDSKTQRIDLFRRREGGVWELRPLAIGGLLELQTVGLTIPVAEIYADAPGVVAQPED